MAKKRMILEEIEEKNDLVPGSPDNPIKLGEKAKNIMIRLGLARKEGNPGSCRKHSIRQLAWRILLIG